MNGACHQLLAGPSLASDQHGCAGRADTMDSLQRLFKAWGMPDDAVRYLPSARESTGLVPERRWFVDRSLHGILQRYRIDRVSASSSVLLSNGFLRKATAPARSAFACIMASSCAETNTIGIGVGFVMSRCCRSRPFMPGSFMSRMAHAVRSKSPRSRKSSAEPNASTVKPADRTSRSIDRRNNSSSSTIATNGPSVGSMHATIVLADGCVYQTLGLGGI